MLTGKKNNLGSKFEGLESDNNLTLNTYFNLLDYMLEIIKISGEETFFLIIASFNCHQIKPISTIRQKKVHIYNRFSL